MWDVGELLGDGSKKIWYIVNECVTLPGGRIYR